MKFDQKSLNLIITIKYFPPNRNTNTINISIISEVDTATKLFETATYTYNLYLYTVYVAVEALLIISNKRSTLLKLMKQEERTFYIPANVFSLIVRQHL